MHMSAKIDWDKTIKRERKLRGRIEQAKTDKEARYWQTLYVGSRDPLRVAARRARSSFPLDRRPPLSAISETADRVSALRGSDEPVMVRVKRKGSHGYRLIQSFGQENKTLQYVVGEALKARTVFHPRQFANSKGRPAAVLALRDALLAGNCHMAEIDIKNCYGSFDGEDLGKVLHLPERLIETVVLATNHNLQIQPIAKKEIKQTKFGLAAHDHADDDWDGLDPYLDHPLLDHQNHLLPIEFFLDEARRGIAQGSCLSPLVAEVLLSPAVAQLPDVGAVVNYADNTALLASSKADLVSMIETLCSSFEEHLAGPLWVKEPKIYEPGEAITFLGYTLTLKNGHVIIEPTEKNLTRFQREFKRRWNRVLKASVQKRSQRIERLRGYVPSWTASFSLWGGAMAHQKQHLALLKQLAD
jgi:hypothetical protein